MKRVLTAVVIAVVVGLAVIGLRDVLAQVANPYQETHEEHLQLEVYQKDAIIAGKDLTAAGCQALEQKYAESLQKLTVGGEDVKKAHHWPDSVRFNQGGGQNGATFFSGPPPEATKAAEPKPTAK
jgi:hypothetical protein